MVCGLKLLSKFRKRKPNLRENERKMPGAVVVPNSPIFSPSKVSHIFHKSSSPSTSACSSPGFVNVHSHVPTLSRSPSSSPLTSRFRRQITAYCNSEKDILDLDLCSSSSTILKRKRPARIDIPKSSLSYTVNSPKVAEKMDVVAIEEEEYSTYCKRGKRATMEDRYSAVVDQQAKPRQVITCLISQSPVLCWTYCFF